MVEIEMEAGRSYAVVHGEKLKLQETLGKVDDRSQQGSYATVYLDEERHAVKVYHSHAKVLSFEKEVTTLQVLSSDARICPTQT
jgi:hypothetical protein